ncbi:MAG: hypothetical protein ACLQHS_01630 [Candidatus Limnocylindrales bacterium]
MKIRKTDASAMAPAPSRPVRALSAAANARLEQYELLRKSVIDRLQGPDDVFKVALDEGEKPATIRQRLLRIAGEEGKEVVVQMRGDHLLVGLMTPDRKPRRGRKPRLSAAS